MQSSSICVLIYFNLKQFKVGPNYTMVALYLQPILLFQLFYGLISTIAMIYEINHFRTIPELSLIFSGIIGVGEPAMLSETTGALHAFRIPLMSVGNRGRQPKIGTYDNILSTAPDIADQAKVTQISFYISYDHRSIIGLQMSTNVYWHFGRDFF